MSFKIDYLIRRYLPIVALLPLNTFRQRFTSKLALLLIELKLQILYLMGISKAERVGHSIDGNIIVKLKVNSSLGSKESTIQLPNDKLFPREICLRGEWDPREVFFLSEGMSIPNSVMLDIGANAGLMTLQVINRMSFQTSFILVEPLKINVAAIQHNIQKYRNHHSITIHNFALSDRNGMEEMHIQVTNRGNSSLLSSAITSRKKENEVVEVKSAEEFALGTLADFENIVVKSDTQGMDAIILSKFPSNIWKNISRAVIEVWALDCVNREHVDQLIERIQQFQNLAWSGDEKEISHSDIRDFWLSKSGKHKNLLIWKE